MNRQLIICCDGTNNNLTGRRRDTNVAQLCELLAPDVQNQCLYYDPGVGNPGVLPEASLTERFKSEFERLRGLALGDGIFDNIAEAYRFLMHHWREGDEICLFGFSRGAFTARSVGGLVTQFGILRPEMDVLLPTLLHVYFLDRQRHRASYEPIREQISELFAADPARAAPVHFTGVWDTVASVGAPLFSRRISASPTIRGKRFRHVRQALALDEFRHQFEPRPYFIEEGYDYAAHGQSIDQLWFAGAHCDVGGGYDNRQAGLSREALLWMVQEAAACGVRLRPDVLGTDGQPDPQRVVALLDQRSQPAGARTKLVHSELQGNALWALAGMTARDPSARRTLFYGPERVVNAPPREHPSVEKDNLQFPANTVWQNAPSHVGLTLTTLAVLVLCWVAAGALLLGPQRLAGADWWNQLYAAFNALPAVQAANNAFAHWQLAWVFSGLSPTRSLELLALHSPRGALLLDLGLIAGYGYLLARASAWAFARVARLRRVGMPATPWLNRLGLAPCVAVLGDLAENALTWLLLATSPAPWLPGWEWLAGAAMTLAALAKWLGLLGSGVLVVWGVLAGWRR